MVAAGTNTKVRKIPQRGLCVSAQNQNNPKGISAGSIEPLNATPKVFAQLVAICNRPREGLQLTPLGILQNR
jgi:hypothetical protein